MFVLFHSSLLTAAAEANTPALIWPAAQCTVVEAEHVPRMDIFTASGGEGLA